MGLRTRMPGRRLIGAIIAVVVVLAGVGILVYFTNRPDEPKTAAEAVAGQPVISSATDARIDSLKSFAEKTEDIGEKYKAYNSLCSAYNGRNELGPAKEYCGKALAIADQAGVSAADKKTLESTVQYIDAKIALASQPPRAGIGSYKEPKE